MKQDELINEAFGLFSDASRPEFFTNHGCCQECKEHDETLKKFNPNTITFKELGNPGWDPICFINNIGYKYYLPALMKLFILSNDNEDYFTQFLFQMHGKYKDQEFLNLLNNNQKQFILKILKYAKTSMQDLLKINAEEEYLDSAIYLWEEKLNSSN